MKILKENIDLIVNEVNNDNQNFEKLKNTRKTNMEVSCNDELDYLNYNRDDLSWEGNVYRYRW